MFQADGGLADPFRGNAAHRRSPGPRGDPPDARPVTASATRAAATSSVTPDGTHRTGRVVIAADAWTNELLARSNGACR